MAGPDTALERCVGNVGRFVSTYWGRTPLHHRESTSEKGFDDLLTLTDVDHMLSTMSLRTPAFRLVKDGSTVDPSSYTKTARTGGTTMRGIADPARMFRLFADGATIVLQGMHRYWAPAAEFCRDLEMALGHPTQINAYVTPPGSRGLAVHHDSHDVFVLQAFGSKRWEVYEAPDHLAMSVDLHPGEALYLPKGTPHAARTQETLSGHLTVGILTSTWSGLLGEVVKELETEAEFDEPLPVGFHRDPDDFRDAVERRLDSLRMWLDKADPSEVADRAIRKFLTTRPPLAEGTLRVLGDLNTITDGSSLRRRRGSICELRVDGDRLRVLLGDRQLDMPEWVRPAMELIAGSDVFTVEALHGFLDKESRLVLVRRLVVEGLLEVAE